MASKRYCAINIVYFLILLLEWPNSIAVYIQIPSHCCSLDSIIAYIMTHYLNAHNFTNVYSNGVNLIPNKSR